MVTNITNYSMDTQHATPSQPLEDLAMTRAPENCREPNPTVNLQWERNSPLQWSAVVAKVDV